MYTRHHNSLQLNGHGYSLYSELSASYFNNYEP